MSGLAVDGARPRRACRIGCRTAGNMFSIFFTETEVVDYDTAKTQDAAAFKAFFHAMLARGVYLPPSAFESWFVSTALDDAALEQIAAALPHAARAAAGSPTLSEPTTDHGARAAARRGPQPRPRSCTGGCPTSTFPSWAHRWPRPRPRRSPAAT